MEFQNAPENWLGLLYLPRSLLAKISLRRIINRLWCFNLISENTLTLFHGVYSSKRTIPVSLPEWIEFINQVIRLSCVQFEIFITLLKDCGYNRHCRYVLDRLHLYSVVSVRNRLLLHEVCLRTFYARTKSSIDDDIFYGGTQFFLEGRIINLQMRIAECRNNVRRLQFLVNQQVLYFYLLTHTLSDIDARLDVLKRMRGCTPHNVDRTLFDVVYHASIAINYAAKGRHKLAVKHKQIAESAYSNCTSAFISILKATAYLYIAGNQDTTSDQAYRLCEQLVTEFSEDEIRVYVTIVKLIHAHSLLGIRWDFQVRDIRGIPDENIQRARDILRDIEVPVEKRRKLWYFMCKGRLFEISSDIEQANENIRIALAYATDAKDINNIRAYVNTYLST